MKKIIVFFLLCFNYAVVGQEISTNKFDELIDNTKQFVIEKADRKKIKKNQLNTYTAKPATQEVLDELEEIKLRKNKNYLNETFFEESIVSDEKFPKLNTFFKRNNRSVEYVQFIQQLLLNEFPIEADEGKNTYNSDMTNESIEIKKDRVGRENKSESNILLYTIVGLVIVGLCVLFYFLYNLNEQKKSLKKDVDRLRNERNHYRDNFSNHSTEVNNEINKLTHENRLLKKDNDEFQRKFNEQHYKTIPTIVVENTVENQKTKPVLKKYFGLPSLEGYFRISVETKENQSSYQFTIDSSNQKKALFELYNLDTANVYNYISDLNSYINPACDKLNAPSDQTQNIEIVESGVVYLENDVWRIEKKCKIKFI